MSVVQSEVPLLKNVTLSYFHCCIVQGCVLTLILLFMCFFFLLSSFFTDPCPEIGDGRDLCLVIGTTSLQGPFQGQRGELRKAMYFRVSKGKMQFYFEMVTCWYGVTLEAWCGFVSSSWWFIWQPGAPLLQWQRCFHLGPKVILLCDGFGSIIVIFIWTLLDKIPLRTFEVKLPSESKYSKDVFPTFSC